MSNAEVEIEERMTREDRNFTFEDNHLHSANYERFSFLATEFTGSEGPEGELEKVNHCLDMLDFIGNTGHSE
jgi:hypothetical protein